VYIKYLYYDQDWDKNPVIEASLSQDISGAKSYTEDKLEQIKQPFEDIIK
jgi:hypothetical protein